MERDTDTYTRRIRVCVYMKNNNSLLLAFIAGVDRISVSPFDQFVATQHAQPILCTILLWSTTATAKKKHKNLAHCHPNPNQITPIMLLMFYVTRSFEQLPATLVSIFGLCSNGEFAPQMSRLKLCLNCIHQILGSKLWQ